MSKANTLRRPRQLRSTAVYVLHWRRVDCDDAHDVAVCLGCCFCIVSFVAPFGQMRLSSRRRWTSHAPLLISHTTRKNCIHRLATSIPHSKGHLQRFLSAPCIFSGNECAYRFARCCLLGRAQPFCCSVHTKTRSDNAAWGCGAYGRKHVFLFRPSDSPHRNNPAARLRPADKHIPFTESA